LATKKIKCFKKFHLTSVPVYDQNTSFLETATLMIPCYDKKVLYARDSLAMAVENLMIQAASHKIGSVCMGRPTTFNKHKRKIKQLVGVEKSYEVPYIIAVGYPVKPYEAYKIPKRKPGETVLEHL
jgi:nitroreductase